jgi:poly-gamma-glutamate capsule biosynthesis protein CapA/YwtB (metallophosphatase superfamily)
MKPHPALLLTLLTAIGCSDRLPPDLPNIYLPNAHPPALTGPTVTILFGGDTHLGESYFKQYESEGNENVLTTRGYGHSLSLVGPLAIDADIAIVNLETPVTDIASSPFDGEKPYIHWSDTERTPSALKALNVAAVSLANNHALDFGNPGLDQTLNALSRHGITAFGAGRNEAQAARPYRRAFPLGSQVFPLVVLAGFEFHKNYDKKYAFYARGSLGGVNAWTREAAVQQVKRARAANPDAFLVLFPHWGNNYKWRDKTQYKLAHVLIDAGADLILGHGAHMLQQVERYKGRWIVYSLGNFVFNSAGRYEKMGADPYSLVAQLTVGDDRGQKSMILRLYPIYSDNRVTNFQPYFVTREEFEKVSSLLHDHSRDPTLLENHLRTALDDSGRYFIWTKLDP